MKILVVQLGAAALLGSLSLVACGGDDAASGGDGGSSAHGGDSQASNAGESTAGPDGTGGTGSGGTREGSAGEGGSAGAGASAGADDGGSAGAGATAGAGEGGSAGGAAEVCDLVVNEVVNGAPLLQVKTSHPEAPPTMTGGVVEDGTYFLTSVDKFNGGQGSSEKQETWVFAGGKVNLATNKLRASGTYTTTDNMITLNLSCVRFASMPQNSTTIVMTNTYTATSAALQVINAGDANEMHTFTRQQ